VADPQTYDDKVEIAATYKTVADDPIYDDRDEIAATQDVYGCAEGTIQDPQNPDQCLLFVPETEKSSVTFYLGTAPVEAPRPACDPQGEGCKDDKKWENIKGAFDLNGGAQLYGTGPQSMDIDWTAVKSCDWNTDLLMCESPLSVVQIKVRAAMDGTDETQGSFVVLVDGKQYAAKKVDALDGTWYTFRAQVGGYPLYDGIIVIHSKKLIILDENGTTNWTPWAVTNKIAPYNYATACDDPPDLADTFINTEGKPALTKYPGVGDFTVEELLVANGVSRDVAHAWVTNTEPGGWKSLKVGQSLALPDSFVAVKPAAK